MRARRPHGRPGCHACRPGARNRTWERSLLGPQLLEAPRLGPCRALGGGMGAPVCLEVVPPRIPMGLTVTCSVFFLRMAVAMGERFLSVLEGLTAPALAHHELYTLIL